MPNCVLLISAVLPLLLAGTSEAVQPERAADLAAPVALRAAGRPIDVSGFAAPFFGDFDEDGRCDLLVGQFGLGRVRVYANVGTRRAPRFDAFEWLQADGQIACVPAGGVVGFSPQLVDFDGDGRTDILTGAFEAELYLFRRRPDGTFAAPEVLENERGEVQLGRYFPSQRRKQYNSTGFLYDWDQDGDGDLLLGWGDFSLVPNVGTRRRPQFAAAVPLMVDGRQMPTGIGGPVVADWDGDDRHDLLVARRRAVVWYRNVGTRRSPRLAPARTLVEFPETPSSGAAPPPPRICRLHAIAVADWNADGRLDLLIGDDYRETSPAAEEALIDVRQMLDIRRRLWDDYRQARTRPPGESREARIERFRQVVDRWRTYAPLKTTNRFQRHGRVWLLERRPAADP